MFHSAAGMCQLVHSNAPTRICLLTEPLTNIRGFKSTTPAVLAGPTLSWNWPDAEPGGPGPPVGAAYSTALKHCDRARLRYSADHSEVIHLGAGLARGGASMSNPLVRAPDRPGSPACRLTSAGDGRTFLERRAPARHLGERLVARDRIRGRTRHALPGHASRPTNDSPSTPTFPSTGHNSPSFTPSETWRFLERGRADRLSRAGADTRWRERRRHGGEPQRRCGPRQRR